MKHLFTYLLLCISAAIILSSCGRSMSLTKRHYRNGYHFEHAGKTSPAKTNNIAVTKKAQEEKTVSKEEVAALATITQTIETAPVSNSNYNTEAYTKHTPANINRGNVLTASASKITLSASVIKQQIQSIKTQMKSDDDDNLSLFWLVILVIIIIWFFGFLGGGWGLGGLINLLLVIALILLILWLLKII